MSEADASGLRETPQRVIESFPNPIALPFELLHGKEGAEARIQFLVDVLTKILKYQAIVVHSVHCQSELVDEDLTGIIRRDLSRPFVSAWMFFVKAALSWMVTNPQ